MMSVKAKKTWTTRRMTFDNLRYMHWRWHDVPKDLHKWKDHACVMFMVKLCPWLLVTARADAALSWECAPEDLNTAQIEHFLLHDYNLDVIEISRIVTHFKERNDG